MSDHPASFIERLNTGARNSISVKLVSIGILILLLMIPASMVTSLIIEREFTSQNAISEVSSKWSGDQTFSGPILSIPYKKYHTTTNNQLVETIKYAHFLPNQLDISAEVIPERRQRGIYEVVVYTSKLRFSGNFLQPSFSKWNINPQDVLFKDAFVSMGITDMRGIKENIVFKLVYPGGESKADFQPGMSYASISGGQDNSASGVSAKIPFPDSISMRPETRYNFSFNVDVNGSRQLFFSPVGKETTIDMSSSWTNPSFDGAFLPDNYQLNESGFKAHWKVLELNRSFPQQWLDSNYDFNNTSFGTILIFPVDHYQKAMRASKYGVMIIGLTYLVFFFVEIFSKRRIHPFQYILVGLALVLFYALLVSISEHINFNLAYLISAVAVIIAISAYARSVFKERQKAVVLGMILCVIYVFMYVIIQMQDYALLTGSIGLFVVLTAVMYISRKIDWYGA